MENEARQSRGEESANHERNKSIAATLCRFHGLIDSSTDELWDDKSLTTILMNCVESGNLDDTLLMINAGTGVNAKRAQITRGTNALQ